MGVDNIGVEDVGMDEAQAIDKYAKGIQCPKCGKAPEDTGMALHTCPGIYVYKCFECEITVHIRKESFAKDSKIVHEWRHPVYIGDKQVSEEIDKYARGLNGTKWCKTT